MSIKVMIAIWYTEFRDLATGESTEDGRPKMAKASSCKSVLLAIADQANDFGEGSYPGLTRLELKTALSRQGIIDVQRALKYNGLLFVANEPSKLGTNDYKINLECFPRYNDENEKVLLVKPLDQSSHLTSASQATLPEVVKPLDLKHPLTIQETTPADAVSPETPLEQEAWYQFEKQATQGETWEGREMLLPQHLPLADWYHRVTGQTCRKAKQKAWMRALADWYANGLTERDLQAAYDADLKWRGVFTSPMELTEKAIALKAAGKTTNEKRETTRQLWGS